MRRTVSGAEVRARRILMGLLGVAALPAIAVLADQLFGRAVAALCGVAWIVWLLSRIDTRSGTVLLLGVLLLIVIAVLGLLLAGLALTHRAISG